MKYYSICIDGIDKTGKDTLLGFIDQLSNHKYIINVRGMMSQIAYADLYKRDFNYDLVPQQHILNVLLTVDYDDWKTRCKLTREPAIDYESNCKVFEDAYSTLEKAGLPVVKYNTTVMTPYMIAKCILAVMDNLNSEEKIDG